MKIKITVITVRTNLTVQKALTTQAIQISLISLISLIIPIHLTQTALTIRMATKISVMIYRLKTSL